MDRIPPYLIATNVNRHPSGPPRNGAALYAWAKDQEQLYEVGLARYLTSYGRMLGFPARMLDWSTEAVDMAHSEAIRKLRSIGECGDHEAYEEALSN